MAGTKVYESRRLESVKIMNETDLKRTKITELLEFIETRLDELEHEKNELKQFQESDRERRCIEYEIYTRQQNEASDHLEKIVEQRERESHLVHERSIQLQQTQAHINSIESKITDLKLNQTLIELERTQLNSDHKELMLKRAQLELVMGDEMDVAKNSVATKRSLEKQLRSLERALQIKLMDLENVLPNFQNALTEEQQLNKKFNYFNLDA